MLSDSSSNTKILSGSSGQTLEAFFKKNQLTPQLFTINPTRRTTIVGKRGTRITILPDSLVDFSGNLVKGEVQIQLLEVFNNRDAFYLNTFSASEDSVLDMGGQLLIHASQNYFPLRVTRPIPVEMPCQAKLKNPIGMRLFSGGVSSTRPFNEQPSFEWKLISNKKLKISKTGNRKYFSFFLLDFNWVGCGIKLKSKRGGSMISAKYVNALGELDECVAFLHFNKRNAIVKLHASGQRFTRFNVPHREEADLIILGLLDGNFYAGIRHFNQLGNQLLRVELQPFEEEAITLLIEEMDEHPTAKI